VTKYGTPYTAKAIEMQKEGFSIQEIARSLKIDYKLAHRLLRKPETGDRGKDRAWSAYQQLLKHDRKWMMSQRRPPVNLSKLRKQRAKWAKERWASRDFAWSTKIISAAAEIRGMAPTRRVTLTAIMRASGLRSLAVAISNLPKCAEVLVSETESVQQWKARRLASK
jgi:hypothetical protein